MTPHEREDAALEIARNSLTHREACDRICEELGAENHAEADEWIYEAEERIIH